MRKQIGSTIRIYPKKATLQGRPVILLKMDRDGYLVDLGKLRIARSAIR